MEHDDLTFDTPNVDQWAGKLIFSHVQCEDALGARDTCVLGWPPSVMLDRACFLKGLDTSAKPAYIIHHSTWLTSVIHASHLMFVLLMFHLSVAPRISCSYLLCQLLAVVFCPWGERNVVVTCQRFGGSESNSIHRAWASLAEWEVSAGFACCIPKMTSLIRIQDEHHFYICAKFLAKMINKTPTNHWLKL